MNPLLVCRLRLAAKCGISSQNRRKSVRLLQSVTQQLNSRIAGRTTVITTHSMEVSPGASSVAEFLVCLQEADTLCTKIGIIAKGQLKCLGTQQHLKNR